MTLFSRADDPWSHRTRIVLAEKSIHVETIDVQGGNLPEDLLDLNPYHTVPTLVDRDLVLYDSRVIIEYLDERFPHPPLMPVDPVARAQFRLALYRIERDWYTPGAADRRRRRSQAGATRAQDPARQHSRQHRRVQGEAVFPVRRVLARGRFHRADPVAPARLGNRSAAAGAGRSASTRIWCSRGRPFATACRASSRRCAPNSSADYGGNTS